MQTKSKFQPCLPNTTERMEKQSNRSTVGLSNSSSLDYRVWYSVCVLYMIDSLVITGKVQNGSKLPATGKRPWAFFALPPLNFNGRFRVHFGRQ